MNSRNYLIWFNRRNTNLAIILCFSLTELVLSYIWCKTVFVNGTYHNVNGLLYYSGSVALVTTIWTSLVILLDAVTDIYTSYVAIFSFAIIAFAWLLQLSIWVDCEMTGIHQKRSSWCLPLQESLLLHVHGPSIAKDYFSLAVILTILVYLFQLIRCLR